MSDNNFGLFVGGGAGGRAEGAVFGGLGISNFTLGVAGLIIAAGLTAHLLNRRNAIYDNTKKHMHNARIQSAQNIPWDDKRRALLSHKGHGDPMNYEDAADDLYAYTCSITLPDTAQDNGDRIQESIRRRKNHLKGIIDSVMDDQISSEEGHQRIHGMSQHIIHELDLPHRDSSRFMPHAMSGFE